MSFLDKIATWVRELLAATGSPDLVKYLWFPVLTIVVFVGAMLAIRKLLPLAGQGGAVLVRVASTVLGAVLFLPDVAIATACRKLRRRPPALLYHYGDAVEVSMMGVARTSGAIAGGLKRLARLHWFLVVLVCGGLLWTWNHGHCPDTAAASCVRPFTSWTSAFEEEPPPPPKKPVKAKK